MTRLDDIISGATDESTSISNLLRKILIVGRQLKAYQISDWAKQELEGYSNDVELPIYRRELLTQVIGKWDGPFGYSVSHPIDQMGIPEKLHTILFTIDLRQSIAELEAWIRCNETKGQHWSSHYIFLYRELAEKGEVPQIENLTLNNVYKEITMDKIQGAIDSVRTEALELALDLQDVNPAAGESNETSPTVENNKGIATVVNNFKITVFGDDANVSYGNSTTQTMLVSRGDVQSFVRALKALDIDKKALEELTKAAETSDDERPSRIRQVLERIKSGVISIGTATTTKIATNQVEQLVQQFLGS